MRKLEETQETRTHTHTHIGGWARGWKKEAEAARLLCPPLLVRENNCASSTVSTVPFSPSFSISISLSILSPTPSLLSFQRCNNSSRPNRPEVGRRFFSRRLAVFQCALCARVSPPLPRQDLFPTLVISALPFVFFFLRSFIFFLHLFASILFFALRSLPIFEFSISRLWLWRERERESSNFHGDVRVDFGKLEESLG